MHSCMCDTLAYIITSIFIYMYGTFVIWKSIAYLNATNKRLRIKLESVKMKTMNANK